MVLTPEQAKAIDDGKEGAKKKLTSHHKSL